MCVGVCVCVMHIWNAVVLWLFILSICLHPAQTAPCPHLLHHQPTIFNIFTWHLIFRIIIKLQCHIIWAEQKREHRIHPYSNAMYKYHYYHKPGIHKRDSISPSTNFLASNFKIYANVSFAKVRRKHVMCKESEKGWGACGSSGSGAVRRLSVVHGMSSKNVQKKWDKRENGIQTDTHTYKESNSMNRLSSIRCTFSHAHTVLCYNIHDNNSHSYKKLVQNIFNDSGYNYDLQLEKLTLTSDTEMEEKELEGIQRAPVW